MATPLTHFRIDTAQVKTVNFNDFFSDKSYYLSPSRFNCSKDAAKRRDEVPLEELKALMRAKADSVGLQEYLKSIKISQNKLNKVSNEYNLIVPPLPTKATSRSNSLGIVEYSILQEVFPEHVMSVLMGEIILDIFEVHPDYGGVPAPVSLYHVYFFELLDSYANSFIVDGGTTANPPIFKKWFDTHEEDCLLKRNYRYINVDRDYILPSISSLDIVDIKYNNATKEFYGEQVDISSCKYTNQPVEIKSRSWYPFFNSQDVHRAYAEQGNHEHISHYWRVKLAIHPWFCKQLIDYNNIGVWIEGYN